MDILNSLKKITTFILDIDGVLTDGSVLVLQSGEWARVMHTKDGYAMQLAIKKGYRIFIVSGAAKSAVDERLRRLGIEEIHFGIKNKKEFVQTLIQSYGLKKEEVLFMGDDMPDVPVSSVVGVFACPVDAVEEVLELADYIALKPGGNACVREVIEKVIKLNNHWGEDNTVVST